MKVKNVEIGTVMCAPLAGYTDWIYRELCAAAGADFVVSEMISAKGLVYENVRTYEYLRIGPEGHPVGLQLFGSDCAALVAAAQYLDQKTDCDVIDINFGCPVPKVTKTGAGSALLKDPEQAGRLAAAIVRAVDKPVMAKLRTGDTHAELTAPLVARELEKAGVAAIVVHGRTRSDYYQGAVDYAAIKAVKEAVRIPVIGNGDVVDGASAQRMLAETGCDGLMIGRAALGNPWIFAEIKAYLAGKPYTPPGPAEKRALIIKHLQMAEAYYGPLRAPAIMRGFLLKYFQNAPYARRARREINGTQTIAAQIALVEKYLAGSC